MLEGRVREEASGPDPGASAAYASALRSLGAREMTAAELRRKLQRKGHASTNVRAALSRLEAEGWLDDLRFATVFLRRRVEAKPSAVRRLRAELAARGCSATVIEEALHAVSRDADLDDRTLARRALERKRWGPDADPRRMARFLDGRGFSRSVVEEALAAREREARTEGTAVE